MRGFFDRFLPAQQRAVSLWLGLGGAAVLSGVSVFGDEVLGQLPVGTGAGMVPQGVAYVLDALAEFALATLVVAVLVRFLRAPKAIALYVFLASMLTAAVALVGLPGDLVSASKLELIVGAPTMPTDPVLAAIASVMIALGVGLGAVAGAWVAETVTLARIRDEGFSGDDPDGKGLHKKPQSRGWAFLGWEGRPVSGDALVAVALVAVSVLPRGVGVLSDLATPLADPTWMKGDSIAAAVITMLALIVAWFFSAKLTVERTGVVAVWIVLAAGLLQTVVFTVVSLVGQPWPLADALQMVAINFIPAVATLAAALAGVAFAQGAKPATIAPPEGPRRRAG